MKSILFNIYCITIFIDLIWAKIDIQSPTSLMNRNPDVKYSLANFGKIPYGKSLAGYLVMSDPADACSPIKPIERDSKSSLSIFLLVEDGECEYDTKSKYAEIAGAKLVVVISGDDQEDVDDQVLNDNGIGQTVGIPTILVSKKTGQDFKSAMKENNDSKVTFSIRFTLPQTNFVNYSLWLSSSNTNSFTFVHDFYKYHQKLQGYVKVNPKYVLWYCLACKLDKYKGHSDNPNCVSHGRYCAPDPDGKGPATGKNVVIEDLRQKCLYLSYPEDTDKWWNYVSKFAESEECQKFINEKCSEQLLNKVGADTDKIKKCIKDSFEGGDQNQDNNLLKEDRAAFIDANIPYWPAVIINQTPYRGSLLPADEVFDAICASFTEQPKQCELAEVSAVMGQQDINYSVVIIIVVIILAAFLFFMIVIYKKMVRRELAKQMDSQINSLVSQYFAMNDTKEKTYDKIEQSL